MTLAEEIAAKIPELNIGELAALSKIMISRQIYLEDTLKESLKKSFTTKTPE